MTKPIINKNTGLDYTIFRDIYNRLENAAQLDVSGNLTVCGDLLVKQCLNVENIVYDTETIYMSGQIISGSKSLSWIDTSGSGVLEDGIKDGFYKKVVKLENKINIIFNGGASGKWEVPEGVTSICVEAYGAGGSSSAYSDFGEGGGGGGSGAYFKKYLNVVPGKLLDYSVGLGGTNSSTPGENSTITYNGIQYISGGGGSSMDNNGGLGGLVSGGSVDINIPGNNGKNSNGDGGNGGNGVGPNGGIGGVGGINNSPGGGNDGGDGTEYGAGGGGPGGSYINGGITFGSHGKGADGGIIITYNESQPYTITYNTTETTVLTDKGDKACFIYNEELGEWIKLNE